jgi:hypothetical protein
MMIRTAAVLGRVHVLGRDGHNVEAVRVGKAVEPVRDAVRGSSRGVELAEARPGAEQGAGAPGGNGALNDELLGATVFLEAVKLWRAGGRVPRQHGWMGKERGEYKRRRGGEESRRGGEEDKRTRGQEDKRTRE